MTDTNKTICIAGKNAIAVAGLNYICDNYGTKYEIIALCDDTDDGVDKAQPSLRKFAKKNNIKIAQINELYSIKLLYFISLEYFKLVDPKKFFSKKLFNLHFSLLPAYKGMYTSAHPILNNEKVTGCTFHLIDEGIDTGEILFQNSFEINPTDTCNILYEKYIYYGIQLVYKRMDNLINDDYEPKIQGSKGSTYFPKSSIDYSDIIIDTNVTAHQFGNQIRAYSFRDYQLPKIDNQNVFGYEILENRSDKKPGFIVCRRKNKVTLATIDFDIDIYFDNLDRLVESIRIKDLIGAKKHLKENPFIINEKEKNGWTPLIISSYNGYNNITELLLDMGADPNITNCKGKTPLMYATNRAELSGDTTGLKLLMEYGSNKNLKDIFNRSIIDYLDKKNDFYDAIIEVLS